MYSKITNPVTGIKVNISDNIGINILRNYINQLGGVKLDNSSYKKSLSFSNIYKLKQVADILNIKYINNKDTCNEVYRFLLERSKINNNIKQFIKNINPKTKDFCKILINSLYNLFENDNKFNNIYNISNNYYKYLLKKNKDGNITKKEYQILQNELHLKLCKCIKKIYIKNIIQNDFLGKQIDRNPYPICIQSIYKNRNIDMPFRSVYKCRENYDWYRDLDYGK